MEKFLVDIEFRYSNAPRYENDCTRRNQNVTIGIYETIEEAIIEGNKSLAILESKFARHKYPNGTLAKKEMFSKNGGPFGTANNLVSNLAYLKTPFEFFAHIKTLKHTPLENVIDSIVNSVDRYKAWKVKNE